MNIDDVESPEEVPTFIWDEIWKKQEKIHKQYKSIEIRSGVGYALVADIPFNLDHIKWQYYLKDLAYRVIEELAEAGEAHLDGNSNHRMEEEIDALHFMVELNVVLGLSFHDAPPPLMDYAYFNVIYQLGLAGNCLKQKPWKQTHHLTDEHKYHTHIRGATQSLIYILRLNLTDDQIYAVYFRKNKVNEFRIRSLY